MTGRAFAVADDRVTLGHDDLAARTRQVAGSLAAAGVGPGDRVAWMMHNRADVVVVALATRRLGAVVVPLSYRSSPGEVTRLLDVARPAVVIVEDETVSVVGPPAAGLAGTRVLNVDAWAPAAPTPARPEVNHERLGAGPSLVFTSGTTGVPKAALRTRGHRALAEAIGSGLGFRTGSRYLASGPLYHSGPWTCALMALARGGSVVLPRRFDAPGWLATANEYEITSTFVTPTLLRRLVEAVEGGHPVPVALENMVVSGEPFPVELKRRAVAAFGPRVLDCYGSTELGPIAAMPAAELLDRPASCGRPFPGVEVAAFDGDRRLGPGAVGLLRARTPLAFDGYVHAAGAAPDSSGQGWATVGDMGYLDPDGFLHIVDRRDDMIISGGVNIFPADVEVVLLEHPRVRRCVVVGLPDERWGQLVCAVVVADGPLDLETLRGWLRGRIADDKRPRRLELVDDLPTTVTEKVSRRIMRDRLLAGVA